MTNRPLLLALVVVSACAGHAPPPPTPTNPAIAALAGRRAQMLQWLHEYEQAGVFPTDGRGMPLSVFRDARGVRCPMAELIHRSGHDELVDAVATANNTLRLADVHGGPMLAWMLTSGLTRDEIIMVQGAVNIGQFMQREDPTRIELAQATAIGEVHGKLETAEVALHDGTPAHLGAATAVLANPFTAFIVRELAAPPAPAAVAAVANR